MDLQTSIERLAYLANNVPAKMRQMEDDELQHKPAPDKWSKLEILGHLIDSAANNLQRFVRIQFEDTPHIVYDQENWNTYSYYNTMTQEQIVNMWQIINQHLLHIMQNIPNDKLERKCMTNDPEPLTLRFLIIDYIAHMEHHLKQIFGTSYNQL